MLSTLLAIDWEPELRGILTVIIGTVVWMGSIYLILGTNLGARLGFLVALTGLAGWMMLMGAVWWIYGIGLKGDVPEWQAGPRHDRDPGGRPAAIRRASSTSPLGVDESVDPVVSANAVANQLAEQGWNRVDEAAPEFGQAEASAGVFLEEEGAFGPGRVRRDQRLRDRSAPRIGVAEAGSQRRVRPHRLLPQAVLHRRRGRAATCRCATEPGRAPTAPEIDDVAPASVRLHDP